MRKFYVLILFVFTACADIHEVDKPDDFYGEDKMVRIMTDLYLIESTITTNRKSFTDLQVDPSQFIYKKYDTDSLTFSNNFTYYTDQQLRYDDLLEKVKQRLEIIKDTVDLQLKEVQKIKKKKLKINKTLTPKDLNESS